VQKYEKESGSPFFLLKFLLLKLSCRKESRRSQLFKPACSYEVCGLNLFILYSKLLLRRKISYFPPIPKYNCKLCFCNCKFWLYKCKLRFYNCKLRL